MSMNCREIQGKLEKSINICWNFEKNEKLRQKFENFWEIFLEVRVNYEYNLCKFYKKFIEILYFFSENLGIFNDLMKFR